MKYLFSLVAATTFVPSVLSHPSAGLGALFSRNNDVDNNRLTRRVVTGATGNVQPRLEIRQMRKEQPDQWILLLLAMQNWQTAGVSDESGYYGISTIHGVPRQDYDGVGHGDCTTCDSADGYCTHNSVLFPAWHRAYVALFEQNFIAACKSVAATFTGSQGEAMTQAANTIRFPYWDWAAQPGSDSTTLPPVLTDAQVVVTGPSGNETITNPLRSYQFSDPSDLVYTPFTSWKNTLRYPSSNDASGASTEQSAINAFTNIRPNLQDQVYQLMSACDSYLLMSNDDASSASSACANSLEAIHNTVHTTSGGPGGQAITAGHMTYLPLAAFDPIFWFHHTNVDRLFAIWQTLHPDSYGATQTAPGSTWTIEQGSSQGPDSPLTPFRKDASTFWTTNDVRDYETTFKYTYPEFLSTDGSQNAVEILVAELYGPSATLTAGSVPTGSGSSSSSSSATSMTTSSSMSSFGSSRSEFSSGSTASGSSSSNSVTGSSMGSASTTLTTASASSTSISQTGSLRGPSNGSAIPKPSQTPKYSNQTVINSPYKANNGSSYEYVCNVNTPRYGLNGSYTVYFFNGAPTSEVSSEWITDTHLIGVVGVLAGGHMNTSDIKSVSSVPLTRTLQGLVKQGLLKDMSEEICVPFLKKNLTWRILTTRGNVVDASSISGFAASVYSSTTSQKNKYSLPKWSGFVQHVDATKDKAGGANGTTTYPNSSNKPAPVYGSGSSSLSPSSSQSATNLVPSYGAASTSAMPYSSLQSASSLPVSSATSPSYFGESTSAPTYSVSSYSTPVYSAPQTSVDVTTITVTQYETVCGCPSGTSSTPIATGY